MELIAVIKAVEFVIEKYSGVPIEVISDSQYVVNLIERKERLKKNNFITSKATPVRNDDLVKSLIKLIEQQSLQFKKVKAHQVNGDVNNREADITVRRLLRQKVKEYGTKIEGPAPR